jgi:hypothetical protein
MSRCCAAAIAFVVGAIFVGPLRTPAVGAENDDVVVLPAFQVKDVRPWLYTTVPGYEILSLENERETRRIVVELQRAGRFMPWFFPPRMYEESAVKSVLFIDRFSSGRTLNEARDRLKVAKVDLFTANSPDAAIQFASAEIVSAWLAGRRSPSSLRFSSRAVLVRPSVPHWYREGVSDLLSAAKVSDTKLEFPGQPVNASTLLTLADLLAVKTQARAIELGNADPAWRARYRPAALLFVRWGLFSDDGIRRSAFVEFAVSAPNFDDNTFQRHFGLTTAELELSLQAFAAEAGRRNHSLSLPRSPSPVALAPVEVRPATETEVGRIVGNSYLVLGQQVGNSTNTRDRYRALARQTLTSPNLDRNDPRLNAVWGAQEFLDHNFEKARPFIDTARRSGLTTPYLYYIEASLRLQAADAANGGPQALSSLDKESVLESLRTGLKLFPRRNEAFRLLADVHLRDEGEVPPADLALLAAGTRGSPESLDLLAKTALLHFRQGQLEIVDELVTRGLASPAVELSPQKATLLGLKQKLQENVGANLIPSK